ncbi:biopolymer transporter ExbB [Limimaricola litoreus]|uniref:Biopolymer transporter ExbB n=1 Tax=Limimaricola litoreus TaxID=2955316 RepID=A0A9X2JPP1_9RHOB|nr:biopolymer transporter ExbB [Limimaricola litoreus]MCP1169813.1 biopolymer transporter ExbB [Limimaricola litoreus]
MRQPEAKPQFSQPVRQVLSMLLALGLVAAGMVLGWGVLRGIFLSNPWLNSAISAFFVLGVLACFWQVIALIRSVVWIETFARHPQGTGPAPGLLLPLATLLRSRGLRRHISPDSARSILESVAQRIDEEREITRYLSNTLIFLGLLGTFYGLATTVPALVDTIRSLGPEEGESGAAVFDRLQSGLETQLGGMGTAFSSSLLGLAGSLVVGLLELFATHGQNRFYRELEEWLSTITRLGYASGEDQPGAAGADAGVLAQMVEQLGAQLEGLGAAIGATQAARRDQEARIDRLTETLSRIAERMDPEAERAALERIAEGQAEVHEALIRAAEGGNDSETRMRLRNMDVQLLRILEEISAGRQDMLAELRVDLASLGRALRQGGGAGASGTLRAMRDRPDR